MGENICVSSACGRILMSEECFDMVRRGASKKGDVFGMARAAGIMGAKRTSELIPLCQALRLEGVEIEFTFESDICGVESTCTVTTTDSCGAEMEALTGAGIALMTIYDMCKSVDRGLSIEDVHLLRKSGRRGERVFQNNDSGELKLWGEKEVTQQPKRGDASDVSLWEM